MKLTQIKTDKIHKVYLYEVKRQLEIDLPSISIMLHAEYKKNICDLCIAKLNSSIARTYKKWTKCLN